MAVATEVELLGWLADSLHYTIPTAICSTLPLPAPLPPPRSCYALGEAFEDMAYAELLWVDRLGVHLRAARQDGSPAQDLRVSFVRAVEDEREARSALTMMAQVAWESQRPYQPQTVPREAPPQDAANN